MIGSRELEGCPPRLKVAAVMEFMLCVLVLWMYKLTIVREIVAYPLHFTMGSTALTVCCCKGNVSAVELLYLPGHVRG